MCGVPNGRSGGRGLFKEIGERTQGFVCDAPNEHGWEQIKAIEKTERTRWGVGGSTRGGSCLAYRTDAVGGEGFISKTASGRRG